MVGTDRKAGHVSLLWESVIAHLGLGVRPDGSRIRVMIKILLRPGHHLMARCARSSDCATDEGL
jgi:hypothetical protein